MEDKDLIAPQWYKRYGSGSSRPLCRGDGETAICAVVAKDPKTGKMAPTGELEEIECSGQDCEHYQSKHCRHTMNLMFILEQAVDGGVFQLDTSSFHSIVNFNSSWDYIRALTGGRIAMVPLKLRLIPKEVTPPSGKKLVYVLELCLAKRMSLHQLQFMAAQGPVPRAALPELDESDEPAYFYPKDVRPVEAAGYETEVGLKPDIEVIAETDLTGDLEPPEETGPDAITCQIADLIAKLGLTPAQESLRWKKVKHDKVAFLALLTAECKEDMVKAAPASEPKQAGWLI